MDVIPANTLTWWRGLPTIEGNTARGASSPANPALHIPDPLSTTNAATSSSAILILYSFLSIQGRDAPKTRDRMNVQRKDVLFYLSFCVMCCQFIALYGMSFLEKLVCAREMSIYGSRRQFENFNVQISRKQETSNGKTTFDKFYCMHSTY